MTALRNMLKTILIKDIQNYVMSKIVMFVTEMSEQIRNKLYVTLIMIT